MTDFRPPLATFRPACWQDDCAVEAGADGGKHGSCAVRSGSYSSVKEDLDGQPQSFFSAVSDRPVVDEPAPLAAWTAAPLPARTRVNLRPHNSAFESLPAELLDRIMTHLALDVPPSDYSPRNRDLVACLLVSRRLYRASQAVLYRQVTFPYGRVFSKFLAVIEANPELGALARRLDLSHFTSLGLGRTRKANGETPNFTATTFRRCLELLPHLHEVLLQEHVDEDTDGAVLRKLLLDMPQLRALDLCGMSRPTFVDAFSHATAELARVPAVMPQLRNLCLHECFTLRSDDLATLLPRLPHLRMLDLHHTRVTDAALLALPPTAALTHLNLGRCTQITGRGVTTLVTEHPAMRGLVYLNLGADLSRHRLLHAEDMDTLLPALPVTLRSLNLNGAALQSGHLPQLVALSQHLEELSISHTNLSMTEIGALVGQGAPKNGDAEDNDNNASGIQRPHATLRYLDLTGVQAVTQAALFGAASTLLGAGSYPLEVLELGSALAKQLSKATGTNARLGWTIQEFGRRSWYVRVQRTSGGSAVIEDPQRAWKMGSRWWGMRKVPVAWSDVGGIYGHYMFKSG